eukprot:2918087-Rhodomonas_salina.1
MMTVQSISENGWKIVRSRVGERVNRGSGLFTTTWDSVMNGSVKSSMSRRSRRMWIAPTTISGPSSTHVGSPYAIEQLPAGLGPLYCVAERQTCAPNTKW